MPGDRGINIFINSIAGYSDLGGLHALVLGGLNIFVNSIAGCSDLGSSCSGDRGIKYF